MENTAFQACSTCSTILTEKLDVKTSNCISLQSKLTSLFVKRSKPQRFGIIYQVLNSHHLLTQKDQQFLINQMYKDHDKIIYLLSWLPRKEDGRCDKFIQSLHQISANTGHGNIAAALLHKLKEFENQNANGSPFVSILIPVYPTTNSARNYYMDGTITVELKKCFNVNIFKEIAIGLFDEYCLPKLGNSFYSTRQSRANSQSCRSVYAVSIETDNKKYLVSYGCPNNKVCYNKHYRRTVQILTCACCMYPLILLLYFFYIQTKEMWLLENFNYKRIVAMFEDT